MLKLHPQIINHDGKEAFAVLPWNEYEQLREMIEDARDLSDLNAAIEESRNEQAIPYDQARRELGLDQAE